MRKLLGTPLKRHAQSYFTDQESLPLPTGSYLTSSPHGITSKQASWRAWK